MPATVTGKLPDPDALTLREEAMLALQGVRAAYREAVERGDRLLERQLRPLEREILASFGPGISSERPESRC